MNENVAKIDRIIAEIKAAQARPGLRPMTSNQLREREEQRRSLATAIKLNGGQVKESYK